MKCEWTDFTLFWVLKNQYYASTGVAPGGAVWSPVENWSVLRLAIRVVPPGDACRNSSIRGTWRLTARVPRQTVWKPFASGDSCGVPSDFWWSRHRVLLALDVRGLRGFGRYLNGKMLEYSWSCGSRWRVIRAFFELWLGVASVPACVLRVVACRLAATIYWDYQSKM